MAVLLLPHLAVLVWVFRSGETSPQQYLDFFYNFGRTINGWPVVWAMPLCLLIVGAVVAALAPREKTPDRYVSAVLYALAIALAAASTFFFGSGLVASLARILPGVVVLGAALAIGLRIISLPWFALDPARSSALERFVLASALGLGVLALLVFLLGSAGVMSPYVWWPLLAVLLAIGAAPLWRLKMELYESLRTFSARNDPVATGGVVICIGFLLAHSPLIWTPPVDYDVLEYHLAGPAQHFRSGQITFLDENLFANMPANAEMLYLLPMLLLQDRLGGLPAAHFIIVAAWALTAAGVYAMTTRIVRAGAESKNAAPVAGAAAALLYLIVPWGSELAVDFYVEHLQALFHVAAVLCAVAFLTERGAGVRTAFGWLVLCGALCGFGIGVKYPTLLFTLAPLLIFVPLQAWLGRSFYEALRAALCLGMPAVTMFAPWLVRNLLASGDALFPLGKVLAQRWAGESALPTRIDSLDVALRPGENNPRAWGKALASLWPGLGERKQWLLGLHGGPHLLAWLPAGLAATAVFHSRSALLLAFVFFWDLGAWLFLTHRIDRFFYPCLTILAVLAGLGFGAIWLRLESRRLPSFFAALALLTVAPLQFYVVHSNSNPDAIVGVMSPQDAARRQYHMLGNAVNFEAWRAIDALPSGSRTLFVGDAQTFYLRETPEYATVFDDSMLQEVLANAQSAADVAMLLRARGITHVYINAFEWARLDRSYALKRRKLEDQKSGWERGTISAEQRKELDRALALRQYEHYAVTWPDGMLPGYLPLTDDAYRMLEEFVRLHTERQWSTESFGIPGLELRGITPYHTEQP